MGLLHLGIEEHIGLQGHVKVFSRPAGRTDKPWELESENDNLIPDVMMNWLGDFLANDAGAAYNTGLTYQAIGTNATAPAAGDTTLGAETHRNTFTAIAYASGTKKVTISTFFAASECTVDMQEVGVFGGSATGAADSGEMGNRALLSYDNSGGNFDLTIETVIELSEVT